MEIMYLPRDMDLLNPSQYNHICQNVPVKTAKDMADQVNAFVEGRLDNQLIETKYLVQNNKNKSYDYEKDSLQLDEFMV